MRRAFLLCTLLACSKDRIHTAESELELSPDALDFGDVALNDSQTLTVTLTNRGRAPFELNTVSIEPPFELGAFPDRLEGSSTLDVTFRAPGSPADFATELVIETLRVPVTARARCQPRACGGACGMLDDGCGGTTNCGACTCVPKTCAELGRTCGEADDGCGEVLTCGAACCQRDVCGSRNCGFVADGCGDVLDCGRCATGNTCGGGGTANVCGRPPPMSACGTAVTPPSTPLGSTCRQQFPPAQGLSACAVPNPGPQFYVDSSHGSDMNNGADPQHPWATLCKALSTVPAGSTLRVAEGLYLDAELAVTKALTVKGGYDATFSDWNPDTHPTVFAGKLTMSDDDAVFAGFHMRSRLQYAIDDYSGWAHWLTAGTLTRNYIEVIHTTGKNTSWVHTVVAQTARNKAVRITCNDIYSKAVSTRGPVVSYDVSLPGAALGTTLIDSNRICTDVTQAAMEWASYAVSGYGSCDATAVGDVTISNNVLENPHQPIARADHVIQFYGCTSDLKVSVLNNTLISSDTAIGGYHGDVPFGTVRWTIANNVLWRTPSGTSGWPVNVAQFGGLAGVEVTRSENNLAFGWPATATTMIPVPLFAANDVLSSATSPAAVFVDTTAFRPASSGPAIGTGVNLGATSPASHDLFGNPRPATGAWDRGAIQH